MAGLVSHYVLAVAAVLNYMAAKEDLLHRADEWLPQCFISALRGIEAPPLWPKMPNIYNYM
jgi:hypothetical protein